MITFQGLVSAVVVLPEETDETIYQLAVHAHPAAAYVELQYLTFSDLSLTFLKQVFPVLTCIFHQVAMQQVIGRGNRFGIIE